MIYVEILKYQKLPQKNLKENEIKQKKVKK